MCAVFEFANDLRICCRVIIGIRATHAISRGTSKSLFSIFLIPSFVNNDNRGHHYSCILCLI